MQTIWKGAVSFGLVNVPVKLHAATSSHDIRFHQVHKEDGGRIRYKRVCEHCGKEVAYSEIAKGYESDDGQLVLLTDEDLEGLPVPSGHEIDVIEFVPSDQVDPVLLDKCYYLQPEEKALKPYVLLREALAATERMAVVKVALRQRETLAVLRVRDKAIVLQTMLWPDEVREPEFAVLAKDVDLRPQELQMANSLVESLAAEFEPERFEDEYKQAMEVLVETKLKGGNVHDLDPDLTEHDDDAEVLDLMKALERSVERAGGKAAKKPAKKGAAKKVAAKKTASKKAPAKKAPAKKKAAKKTA